jgi:hypothetical protein
MPARVFSMLHDGKILWPIIGAVSVDVVNGLIRKQRPSQDHLHYEAMNATHLVVSATDNPIALQVGADQPERGVLAWH